MNINTNKKIEDEVILKFNPIIIMEYLKWLNYIPDTEIKEINNISEKSVYDLNKEEKEILKRFNESVQIIPKLNKYLSDDCTKKDIESVHNYIMKHGIEDIMKSKLNENQIKQAMNIMSDILNQSYSKLEKYALKSRKKEIYETLSIEEAYALYYIDKIYINLSAKKINDMLLGKNKNVMKIEDHNYIEKQEDRVRKTLTMLKRL